MFQSFFPKPKFFFISTAVYGLCMILFWYFFKEPIAELLGFVWPSKDVPTIVGISFFVTGNFLAFYLFYFLCVGIWAGFWFVYAPHKWQYWALLGAALIVFLSFINVQISVSINYWYREFYDLIQNVLGKTVEATAGDFYSKLFEVVALLLFGMGLQVVNIFFVRHYIFRWRIAMNEYYTSKWTQLRHIEGASQRVQEDTMRFAQSAEKLGDKLTDSLMTLVAFLPILAGLSQYVKEIPIFGEVTNALMWCAIMWPLFGTVLVLVFGIKLPGLEFKNQRVEAAYRKELVLGEDDESRAEPPTLRELFTNVRHNYFRLYFHYFYFEMAFNLYRQADVLFLLFVMSPSFAATTVTYGIFVQINAAFSKVSTSFQYLFTNWKDYVELISIYKRLAAFEAAIDGGELPAIDQEYLAQNK